MFPSGFIADPDTPVVLQHDRFRGGFAGFEANPLCVNPAHIWSLPAQTRTLPAQIRTLPAQIRTLPAQTRTLPAQTRTLPAQMPPLPPIPKDAAMKMCGRSSASPDRRDQMQTLPQSLNAQPPTPDERITPTSTPGDSPVLDFDDFIASVQREDDAFWGSFLLPRRSFDQDECISVGTPCPSTQEYLVTFTLGDDAPSRGAVATSSVQHASTSKETSRRTSLDSPQELSNEFDESIGGGTASRKRKRDPNMGAASSARAVCTR
ncbi:unnamed protein product [Zymoseptoria tritici ST99CH_1A5]|uniref:Uncharacterized protein n=2 Tax=Zymoseptoria tritici TaxID=1047171 RepID=A0A2H1H9K3_ZYMTR|nr:unnamed protein product [Zymoseptoria tritici ST99CH_1E4]SMR65039.1 unnamed protein product [Zymoseptoria tritici ST99CH_3D1]SMY30441.1 unnamed protein product [Zymoseptoria tritici ST99CH_1A5]